MLPLFPASFGGVDPSPTALAPQILAEHSLRNRCDSCLSRYPQSLEYRACGKTLNNQGEKDETEDQHQDFIMPRDRHGHAEGERQRERAAQPGPHQRQAPRPRPELRPPSGYRQHHQRPRQQQHGYEQEQPSTDPSHLVEADLKPYQEKDRARHEETELPPEAMDLVVGRRFVG